MQRDSRSASAAPTAGLALAQAHGQCEQALAIKFSLCEVVALSRLRVNRIDLVSGALFALLTGVVDSCAHGRLLARIGVAAIAAHVLPVGQHLAAYVAERARFAHRMGQRRYAFSGYAGIGAEAKHVVDNIDRARRYLASPAV